MSVSLARVLHGKGPRKDNEVRVAFVGGRGGAAVEAGEDIFLFFFLLGVFSSLYVE